MFLFVGMVRVTIHCYIKNRVFSPFKATEFKKMFCPKQRYSFQFETFLLQAVQSQLQFHLSLVYFDSVCILYYRYRKTFLSGLISNFIYSSFTNRQPISRGGLLMNSVYQSDLGVNIFHVYFKSLLLQSKQSYREVKEPGALFFQDFT